MKHYPLPILYTLVTSAYLMRDRWRIFVRCTWPYLAVTLVSQMAPVYGFETDALPMQILFGLVFLVAMAWATVRLHRDILLTRSSAANDVAPVPGMRELRIIGYWLLMCVTLLVVMLSWVSVSGAIGLIHEESGFWTQMLITAVTVLMMVWLISRCGLVIPATAIDDEPRGLRFAWRLSQEHKRSLFVLTGLIPMSSGLLFSNVPADGNWLLALGFGLLSYVAWMYEICILSLSYQWIVQRQTIDKLLQQSHLKSLA
ncbi:sugar transporter [Vibrio furnissii]